jgi:putative endonuclease
LNLGRQGEESALKFLVAKGMKLVAKNFRFERAEIDLIFKDDESKTVVFVEVKTRTNKKFGEPVESITYRKTEQIYKSAEGFVVLNPEYIDYTKRFDVVAIMMEGKSESISHIENAF